MHHVGSITLGDGDVVHSFNIDFCIHAVAFFAQQLHLVKVDEIGTVTTHQRVAVADFFDAFEENAFEGVSEAVSGQLVVVFVEDVDIVAGRLDGDDAVGTDDEFHVAFVVDETDGAFVFLVITPPQSHDGALGIGDALVAVDAFGEQPVEGIGVDCNGNVD